ncbi:uncharacterized protein B0I36DRAFT_360141 [Microdochium trichocladiopsis]|uniref:Uncharacterized protein n=1 Tax=Microdochium trichocladiopsis TaxID=1682393 RepID=A0A9P9BSD1_9PEZI|nr:uncharacterized protein B0I36DRAFT_360141 [Microdochium trichocladiopsis]KAH7034635.1 hypothetical protein B0I36DRAFT_360141 [Microdochium trichocladiopsis]
MKFIVLFTILSAGTTMALPAALQQRDTNGESAFTPLPYGMKSTPDCPEWKDYCIHCDESDFDCITSPVCDWCRTYDASWGGNRVAQN